MSLFKISPSSFRDPSGFIFKCEDEIFRAISLSYFEEYDFFIQSGLYQQLANKNLIVSHTETSGVSIPDHLSLKIIKPEQIPFISYPYEWCFSQLKSAALLTLHIQKTALKYGMTLKDASAYNIQFTGCKPIFIDTLSFEKYIEGAPWIAYKQFCQHFLAPLSLMVYKSVELNKLLANYIDGIPLELTSSLLPKRAMLNSGIASHIILHAKFQKGHETQTNKQKTSAKVSKKSLLALIEHLENCIRSLQLKSKNDHWVDYSSNNTYSKEATQAKEQVISKWLSANKAKYIYDLGCNTGSYSQLAANYCEHVIAIDSNHNCIDKIYLQKKNQTKILPLVINLSTPTPAIGWANKERLSIQERAKADVLLALALIHHLRISNNVPFHLIAEYFSELCQQLIIEYVPKNDSMVQHLLASRKDIFPDYTLEAFLYAFEKKFTIIEKSELSSNGRMLLLMTKKN